MSTTKLKLNPDKTEFILPIGSKGQRDKLKACFQVDILRSPVCLADSVKNRGVWLDSDFYCVNTSYPMDNSLSGRRRPARQTSEKDVLCFHQQVGP